MLADRIPASVEASDVTIAWATAVATAIAPAVMRDALTVAVFADVEVALTLVPCVTLPRKTAFVEPPTSESGSCTLPPNKPPAAPSESAAAWLAELAVTEKDVLVYADPAAPPALVFASLVTLANVPVAASPATPIAKNVVWACAKSSLLAVIVIEPEPATVPFNWASTAPATWACVRAAPAAMPSPPLAPWTFASAQFWWPLAVVSPASSVTAPETLTDA